MTVKTDYSRFDVHDVLTAPEGSVKFLEGRLRGPARSPSSSASSRAPRPRCAPTRGCATSSAGACSRAATRERIALAVAERRGDPYSIAQHARTARAAGLGLDEVSRARSFRSADEKEAALLAFLEAVLATDGRPSAHLGEEAREAGWTDEQILEAVAHAGAQRVPEPDLQRGGAAAGPNRPLDPPAGGLDDSGPPPDEGRTREPP